jgi:hypothetical protein
MILPHVGQAAGLARSSQLAGPRQRLSVAGVALVMQYVATWELVGQALGLRQAKRE